MSTEYRLYNVEKKDMYYKKSPEEREKILLEMVQMALEKGFKPTARKYNTYPSTVRRWVKKYQEGGEEALKIKYKRK